MHTNYSSIPPGLKVEKQVTEIIFIFQIADSDGSSFIATQPWNILKLFYINIYTQK